MKRPSLYKRAVNWQTKSFFKVQKTYFFSWKKVLKKVCALLWKIFVVENCEWWNTISKKKTSTKRMISWCNVESFCGILCKEMAKNVVKRCETGTIQKHLDRTMKAAAIMLPSQILNIGRVIFLTCYTFTII